VVNVLAKNIIIPVYDLRHGTNSISYLEQFKQSQWFPLEKIITLQNEHLNKIISHAYNNVPYYYNIFDERGLKPADIRTADDLIKLPILTKSLIRKNIESMQAKDSPRRKIFANSTSGSTDEPLKFYSTFDDFYNWGFGAVYRAYNWAGYDIGDKNMWIRGKFKYASKWRKYLAESLQLLENTKFVDPVSMNKTQILQLVSMLEHFKPAVIRGYPSAIAILAGYIERELKTDFKLKTIISTGEQLYDHQRNLFSRVFNCDTYNHYGTMEVRAIASECPAHSGLHIAVENVIVEIVDKENRQLPPGQEGKILVTNLHNYTMPFIRYDIGDIGTLSDETCPCGRGLPLMAKLNGRTADVIVIPGNIQVSGTTLVDVTASLKGIEQFQIVQEDNKNITVNVIPEKKYKDTSSIQIMNDINNEYKRILGDDMDFTVRFVDIIEATNEGKRRIIKSRIQ
jgi:phenylacetate-CoA ligase